MKSIFRSWTFWFGWSMAPVVWLVMLMNSSGPTLDARLVSARIPVALQWAGPILLATGLSLVRLATDSPVCVRRKAKRSLPK